MSIAVDQSRLRRISEAVLPDRTLEVAEATRILEISQLAAGVDLDVDFEEEDPAEQATLQAVAQQVFSMVGMKPGEVLPIPPVPDEDVRSVQLGALAAQLTTRGARELAYVLAFLVSVADLELTPAETAALEELQHALGLDHRRAMDLIVMSSEIVAADGALARSWIKKPKYVNRKANCRRRIRSWMRIRNPDSAKSRTTHAQTRAEPSVTSTPRH